MIICKHKENEANMIFITFLTLFALYSADHSQFSQGYKCCLSFSKMRIPLKQIKSYHTTHLEYHRRGLVFITKRREFCADPNERWVQKLRNLVDSRTRWEISFLRPKQRSTPESKPEPKTAPVSQPEPESEQELMPAPVLAPEPKSVLESEKEPEPKMAPVSEHEPESEQEPKPMPVLEPEPKLAPESEKEPEPKMAPESEHEPESEQEPKPAAVSELKPESEPEPESNGTQRTPCQRLALEKVSTIGTTQLRLESPHMNDHTAGLLSFAGVMRTTDMWTSLKMLPPAGKAKLTSETIRS